jgi:tetratricopeptide (TPR) repeat protein
MRADRIILRVLLGVLPLAFWPGSTSFETPKLLLFFLAAGGLVLLHSCRIWRGQEPIPRPSRGWLILAGLFLVSAVIGLFRAPHFGLALRTVLLVVGWLVILGSLASSHPDFKQIRLTLGVLVASASLVCLYCLLQIAGWLPGAAPDTGMPPGISTLGNQNYVAGLAAALLWPALILLPWGSGRPVRWLAVPAVLVLGSTVLLAKAMGPQAAVLISGIFLLVALFLGKTGRTATIPRAWSGLFLLLVAAGTGFTFLGMRGLSEAPSAAGPPNPASWLLEVNNGGIRTTDWIIATSQWRSSILTGSGPGGYSSGWIDGRFALASSPQAAGVPPYMPPAAWAHNEYLQLLAETGLLGLAVCLLILEAGRRAWLRAWRRQEAGGQRRVLLISGGLLAVAVHALVSFPFHLPATSLALAVLLGALLAGSPAGGLSGSSARGSGPQARILAASGVGFGLLFMVVGLLGFLGDLQIVKGKRLYTAGNWARAQETLDSGIELALWPGHGHLYRGLSRWRSGDLDGAAADLERSLHTDPTYEALVQLAELELDRRRFARSEELARRVLACQPYIQYQFQARFCLGLSALRQNDRKLAGQTFELLARDDPTNHRAHLALGYLAALAGETEVALDHYRRARECVEARLSGSEQGLERAERAMLVSHRQTILQAIESLK